MYAVMGLDKYIQMDVFTQAITGSFSTDGVLGCELPNGDFVEESNFFISEVKMQIKVAHREAGWIVMMCSVKKVNSKSLFGNAHVVSSFSR